MYRIGDFSKLTGLSIKTLRFYHEKGLLVPAAVEPGSGYREYNDANLEKARAIVALRSLEFSLDDISEMLREFADESDLVVYLERRKAELARLIERQQDIASLIDRVIQTENEARQVMRAERFQIETKRLEPRLVAGIRFRGRYRDCGSRFATLGRNFGRQIRGAPFCLYYDDEFRDEDADLEACFPIAKEIRVDGVSVRELPGGTFLSLLHRGPYDLLGRSYAKVLAHASERKLSVALPSREEYLKGPGMIFRGNPRKYLTEIQLPIAD